MKHLLIILLVSILTCFLVINSKSSDKIIKVVEEQIQYSLEPFIKRNYEILASKLSSYPPYLSYFEAAIAVEKFIDTLTVKPIPTNINEARAFATEQKANHELYFELLEPLVNKHEKESLWGSTDFTFNENYYHHNSKFQSLLQNIYYKNLAFKRLRTTGFLLYETRHTGLCFNTFEFPQEEVIQINKVSTFPIVFANGCGRQERNIIYKIWVNDRLIYDMLNGDIIMNGKVNLSYQGEKNHRVKIEFRENFFTPKRILEKTFDYELNTCD